MATDDRRFEGWCFLGYASGDLHHARLRVREAVAHSDLSVQFALIEVAVVNYARPFSGNRGKYGNDGRLIAPGDRHRSQDLYRLPTAWVPSDQLLLHEELVRLRHTLFAHTDLGHQDPGVLEVTAADGQLAYPMTVRPADYRGLLARAAQMEALIDDLTEGVQRRRLAQTKEDWFRSCKAGRLQQALSFGEFREVGPGQFQSSCVIDIGDLIRRAAPGGQSQQADAP